MRDERRAQLRRKYLELGVGELVAAAVVVVAIVMPRMEDPRDQFALFSALTPLLVILAGWCLLASGAKLGRAEADARENRSPLASIVHCGHPRPCSWRQASSGSSSGGRITWAAHWP
jgi:hypothetical protein